MPKESGLNKNDQTIETHGIENVPRELKRQASSLLPPFLEFCYFHSALSSLTLPPNSSVNSNSFFQLASVIVQQQGKKLDSYYIFQQDLGSSNGIKSHRKTTKQI